MLKKYKILIIKIALITLLVLAAILIYVYVEPVKAVINVLIVSFIVAYILKPLKNYMCKKLNISSSKSSLLIILILVILFIGLLYCIIPAVIKESGNFGGMIDSIELYILSAAERFNLNKLPIFETIYIQVGEKINMALGGLSNNLVDNMISVMENLIGLAVVPIITYYLLADGEFIYNRLLLIFPTNKRILIKRINNNIDRILSKYIVSQLLLCGIIGILSFILLLVLRVKFPFVLSLINAFANIIPYFGPIIGGVPIIFIALTGSVTKGILAAVGVMIIQQVEGNFLAPKMTGDSTNMHPIIIIILLIIGEKLGGVIGMVLIVPIAVIIKVVYDDINYYLF